MYEIAGLLAVVAIIYLSDCLAWIDRGRMAMRGRRLGAFVAVDRNGLVEFRDKGLVLGGLLPGSAWIVSLPKWDEFAVEQDTRGAFREPVSVTDLRDRMDFRRIATRFEAAHHECRTIDLLGRLSFGGVFFGLPLLMSLGYFGAGWPYLAVLVAGAHLAACTRFTIARRRLEPIAVADSAAWLLWVSPLSSMRASDLIMRRVFDRSDPIAAAFVLGGAGSLESVSRAVLEDCEAERNRARPSSDHDADAFRVRVYRKAASRLLRAVGVDRVDGIDTIHEFREESLSYCPNCLAEFAIEQGTCNNCDTGLRRIRADARAAASRRRDRVDTERARIEALRSRRRKES